MAEMDCLGGDHSQRFPVLLEYYENASMITSWASEEKYTIELSNINYIYQICHRQVCEMAQ